MGSVLGHLNPALVWNHFEEISKYPRPSKFEEKIAAYVKSVGERNKLVTIVDKSGNIVIKKPATPGYEHLKTVILQGHIDMVCEKNRDVQHDFDNDPIIPYIDGEWVKAKGTTLGADNGIGVAAALAVLEDNELKHGPIECLFTVDEETGLTGASNLEPGLLDGKILINMDSEEEGSPYIGCSGGKNTQALFRFTPEAITSGAKYYEVKVAGLRGGHSGLEIHSGLGNAIKILTRLLLMAQRKFGLRISQIEGGNKHNAIPREAFAIVSLSESTSSEFEALVKDFNSIVKEELSSVEKNLQVSADQHTAPTGLMPMEVQNRVLQALNGVPHGVIKMSADIPELVETSTNLATIKTENNAVHIVTSQRSSVASEIIDIVEMTASVLQLAGAELSFGDGYPGWKPNVSSEVLGIFKNTFKNLYGKEPEVKAIHAGLECGIIGEKYPGLDMISFGPTMFGVHSPDERLKIDTVPRFYELLKNVLTNIPKN